MDFLKKYGPIIVILVVIYFLYRYFVKGGTTATSEIDQKNQQLLEANDPAKNQFQLTVEKIEPGIVEIYAQGNGNGYQSLFSKPPTQFNYNPNGKYNELFRVDSADNDFRFVILDYQYFQYNQIDDHTTYFLLFRTFNYSGKNGIGEATEPAQHNIANSIHAVSMNWLTGNVNILK